LDVFNYYQNNQTAVDDLINEIATIYGNETIPPELTQLLKAYFNFTVQNYECIYSAMCVSPEGVTTNVTSSPINLFECVNCNNAGQNEYYDFTLMKCRCIDGYYRDPMTGYCLFECSYCGEFEVYNSTVEACVCIPGYVRVMPQANCTLP
jgi:hypothetical protein